MTVSRGRRSRESRKSPSENVKDAGRINPDQKKFLRKLLYVLADIVDEKGHFRDGDGVGTANLTETDWVDEREENKLEDTKDKGAEAHGRPPHPSQGHQLENSEKREGGSDAKNLAHFKRLCETHGQLTFQIRSSLNALGGGGRTARALESMHDKIISINASFSFLGDKTIIFWPRDCMRALNASHKAALEVTKSFRELGVFNTSFFGKLEDIEEQLKIAATKLDVEYSSFDFFNLHVDDYVDSILEPLAFAFEAFLRELTNIAEKATIRLTQDFSSQRYLNLTTVATFLSSVTATTLQITADDSISALETVMNTLWFISLVFSTASAVYSLLVMTWRQSSVRRPDQLLPPWASMWLRNGPMYALIAAVMTFSIGLCLLAFQVADRQGHLASAAVPTAFAGLNACAIFLISAWFLLEQWKERHTESWLKARDEYLIPMVPRLKRAAVEVRDYGHQVKRRLGKVWAPFTIRRHRVPPSSIMDKRTIVDVESGRGATVSPPEASANDEENPEQLHSEQSNAAHDAPEATEPENMLAVPERTSTPPESDTRQNEFSNKPEEGLEEKYKPFENLLQFSLDGRLLASAFSDTMVIYDVRNSFAVLNTYKLPDADPVKQITWNPRGELLVRSSRRVSVYGVNDMQIPNDHLVGHLQQAVRSVRWVGIDDAGVRGFACAISGLVKVFDETCKELRSYDLSRIAAIDRIIDVAFFRRKYILCLVDSDAGSRFLIINMDKVSIERECQVGVLSGQISMIISQAAGRILFHGSEDGVEVVELLTSDDHNLRIAQHDALWRLTYSGEELARPEEVLAFHGKDDKMIIGVSEGEIVVLYRLPEKPYSALHIFTTPSTNAIMQNPVSFAVRPDIPYMFAFSDGNGSVKIWSVQSDRVLSTLESGEDFEVHDRRRRRSEEPTVSTGRFLTLPPPATS